MSRPISDPVFDIGRDLQRAYDEGYKQGRYDEKVETETSLPSGEQTHALRTETHACDLIKRQDAIDGTVIITVDDYTKVNRIIVKDESHFGCVFEPVDYDEEVGGTMTREEAIEWLIQIQDKYIHDGDEQFDAKRKEALGMAIEALRSDRPKGEWIPYLPEGLRYKCSECESRYDTPWHFCPNSGADMRGEDNE